MTVFKLADAKAHLSELVDRAQSGETVSITKHGKAVAQLGPAMPGRKPISFIDLQGLTNRQPRQSDSAGDFIRRMRDEDRY